MKWRGYLFDIIPFLIMFAILDNDGRATIILLGLVIWFMSVYLVIDRF